MDYDMPDTNIGNNEAGIPNIPDGNVSDDVHGSVAQHDHIMQPQRGTIRGQENEGE